MRHDDTRWAGMTLIQTCVHKFNIPLGPGQLPGQETVSPTTLMSYAIQTDLAQPWRQLVLTAWLPIRAFKGVA